MDSPAVEVTGLGHSWGAATALEGLDFEVLPGEIFGIVGPDGAGKTTLMRILAAVTTPSRGDARICGRSVRTQPDAVHDITGYVCQTTGLYQDLTVSENIAFFAGIRGISRAASKARSGRLLEATGLAPFGNRRAAALSGGMKQKLALVCSLLHDPGVLILDEPTNGVDPMSRREFWSILSELAGSGVSVILATSYLDEAERCSRSCLISEGRAVDIGTPAEIRGRSGIRIIEVSGHAHPALLVAALRESGKGAVSLRAGKVRIAVVEAGREASVTLEVRDLAGPGSSIEMAGPSLEDVLAWRAER